MLATGAFLMPDCFVSRTGTALYGASLGSLLAGSVLRPLDRRLSG